MKSVGRELLSTGLVLSVPLAVGLAFPFESIAFKARSVPAECAPSAAFVVLTPEGESAALLAAKTSWQSDASAGQRMRIRLPLSELPEESKNTVLDIHPEQLNAATERPLGYAVPPWQPSQRAAAPAPISRSKIAPPPPAFSREELLKLK